MAAPATAAAAPVVKKPDAPAVVCTPLSGHPGWHEFVMNGQKFTTDVKYNPIKVLGQGAYGIVVSATDSISGKKVAIKKIGKAFDDLVDGKRILREVKLLRHFDHLNIIALRDLFGPPVDRPGEPFEDIYLVMGYMETDLHKIIHSKNVLTDDHIQYFIYQLLRALKFIHSAHVLHRDLKPSNLLVNSDCALKICDFGLARGFAQDEEEMKTVYVVTRWYRAPEILVSCQTYDYKIDVWSVGCILAELHGRKPIFPGEDYMGQLTLILNVLGSPEEKDLGFVTARSAREYILSLEKKKKVPLNKLYPAAKPAALDLMDKMLTFSPDRRVSVEEALRHPYFASLHNAKKEPECKAHFDFTFERIEMTKEALQDFMWEEIFLFRPAMRPAPDATTIAAHATAMSSTNASYASLVASLPAGTPPPPPPSMYPAGSKTRKWFERLEADKARRAAQKAKKRASGKKGAVLTSAAQAAIAAGQAANATAAQ